MMSVVRFSEHWEGRDLEVGAPDEGSATRRWIVVTDNKFDTAQAIVNFGVSNGYLPERFSPHPDNAFLTARKIRCKQQSESPLFWEVVCQYSSSRIGEEEKDKDEIPNPLNRPAKVRWGSVRYQKPVDVDRDGKAVVNSAGDYFDPPPEIDTSRWTVSIQKNVLTVPAWLLEYSDAVNSDAITIDGYPIPAGAAKMMQIDISELQNENGITFRVLTITVELKPVSERGVSQWELAVLDQGFRTCDTVPTSPTFGERREILIEDPAGKKHRPSAPVLLDGHGQVLANPALGNAKYQHFDIYPSKPFSVLPLV